MDSSQYYRLYVFSIFGILFFGAVDLAATNILVGNGICYELNPWIEYLMNKHGVYKALALSKFPGLLLVALLGLYKSPPKWAAFSMFIVAWLYALILAWHLYIICYTKVV